MPRLRNTAGVTVSVSDETAALLDSSWVDADSTTGNGGAAKSETPDKSWKNADLTAFAGENGIDLEGATKKEDILAKIAEASGSTATGNSGDEGSDDDTEDEDDQAGDGSDDSN